jgi:hypothetical protein
MTDFAGRAVIAFALLVAILFAGCSGRLPDYGLPRTYPGGTALPDHVVSYRNLVVADFQATKLPDFLYDHTHELNAHTAVAIRTVPGAHYILSPPPEDRSTTMYSGRVENLVFEAVMIPAHSWWNPSLARDKTDYVLQHEQIHFALMELAARRLTERAVNEQDLLSVEDTSGEAVQERLLGRIDQWMAESEEEVVRQHTEFDKATSHRYAPAVQQQWFERVQRELKGHAGRD